MAAKLGPTILLFMSNRIWHIQLISVMSSKKQVESVVERVMSRLSVRLAVRLVRCHNGNILIKYKKRWLRFNQNYKEGSLFFVQNQNTKELCSATHSWPNFRRKLGTSRLCHGDTPSAFHPPSQFSCPFFNLCVHPSEHLASWETHD
jgi:hypothetical protein